MMNTVKTFMGQGDEVDVPPPPDVNGAHSSIRKLISGNQRYLRRSSGEAPMGDERDLRRRLSTLGQNPWAILISCSDSRVPVERIFDASPGDLFVVRVAGNICGSPVGGVIGSAEYGVEHLHSPMILVLGHTKCGAVSAAVRCSKDGVRACDHLGRNLGAVVGNIRSSAVEALATSPRPETPEQIEHAIKLNVYHSMEQLLKWSTVIQQAVSSKSVEIQGGIYDITTGKVSIIGKHPREEELLAKPCHVIVRTGSDAPMPAVDALATLKSGNQRYIAGDVESKVVDAKMRGALVEKGQRPLAVMLGCADSRIPIDYVFDTNPGDLFVVRNAGSVCGPTSGGLIGSIEYGVGHLKSQLLVVLGHTQCGAVAAAMDAHLAQKQDGKDVPEGLKALLDRLKTPVKMAVEQCSSTVVAERVELAIEINVWHTVEQLLQNSSVLMDAVCAGTLQIHGAIYDLKSGCVRFMGEHPRLHEVVAAPLTDKGGVRGASHGSSVSTRTGGSSISPAKPPGQVACKPASIVPQPTSDDDDLEVQKITAAWQEKPHDNTQKKSEFSCEPSMYVETKNGRQHLKDVMLDPNNWRAGITVAFVSVPLSIALGIASGTSPMRGVSCAVFGGLCASIFGSSDYNIVGPAGALSGMLMSYVVQWGEDVLPWISLISAVICAICALLRLDVYMLMMPKSVFEGFTVGVALIIGLNQINFACGLMPGVKHKLFMMNIVESLKILGETQPASLIVFVLQAPMLWLLMRKFPKIPWTLIFPILSIPFGLLCDGEDFGFELLTLKSKYGTLKPELVAPLRTTTATFADLLIPSFSVAIVAVLETLISAKIASDRVDRPFNELIELRGLVVSHVVCGLTGSMPPTGVFVRTSLNASLGATHRFAQLLNACCVAIIALICMPVFSFLPQATIAAILVVASIRMCPMSYLRKLWVEDKGSLALCLVTALVCVGEDPVIGLAAGLILALLISAKKHMKSPFLDIKSKPSRYHRAYMVSLHGALTYINAENFVEQARKLDDAIEITLDMSGLRQADHDGICAINKVVDTWRKSELDCKVWLKGVNSKVYPALAKFSWFARAEDEGLVQK